MDIEDLNNLDQSARAAAVGREFLERMNESEKKAEK